MKTYTLKKIHGAPDWSAIPVMPIDTILWTDSIDVTAQAQICWDADALYLRMEATEPHIRKEQTGPLDEICDDSCLEFFLQPTDAPVYLNFEINPLCNYLIGQGTAAVHDRLRIRVPDFETRMAPKAELTENGWVLTYKIPFDFVRLFYPQFKAEVGVKVRANCYKCGDETVKPHFLAWNPVVNDFPAFHKPEYFGCLVFGE